MRKTILFAKFSNLIFFDFVSLEYLWGVSSEVGDKSGSIYKTDKWEMEMIEIICVSYLAGELGAFLHGRGLSNLPLLNSSWTD